MITLVPRTPCGTFFLFENLWLKHARPCACLCWIAVELRGEKDRFRSQDR